MTSDDYDDDDDDDDGGRHGAALLCHRITARYSEAEFFWWRTFDEAVEAVRVLTPCSDKCEQTHTIVARHPHAAGRYRVESYGTGGQLGRGLDNAAGAGNHTSANGLTPPQRPAESEKPTDDTILTPRVRRRRNNVTPALLARVAEVYRANIDTGTQAAIAAEFDISTPTASDYVMRARKAGYLPPTKPGVKRA